MGPDRLPFGLGFDRVQASGGYRCSEQYEWQRLALRQREQAAREKPHCGATLNYPLHSHRRDRIEDSVAATEIPHQFRGHDLLHSHGKTLNDRSCSHSFREEETKDLVSSSHDDAETEKNFAIWDQPLDRTGLLESKRHRRSSSPRYCMKSYPFGNKIDGYHGEGRACPRDSSKWGNHSLSPDHAPTSCLRTEGEVPSLNHVSEYAKGADGHMRTTERLGDFFSSNQGSCTQNRSYQEVQRLPTEVNFPNAHFSVIDEARHRSYMEKFQTCKKHQGTCSKDLMFNISDHSSVGRTCHRFEVGRAHTSKAFDEFHAFHHEQLHQSPRDNFRDQLGSNRNFRNAHKGKMSRRQCTKHDLQKKNSNVAFHSTYGRNSDRKRHGDHLDGHRAKRNMPSENQSKESCYPNMKDWQSYSHGDVCQSGDNQEGNTKKIKKGGQNGEIGNYHRNNNIPTVVCSGSKFNENSGLLSPKCRSKTIMSSNGPKQSEGSENIKLESDKKPSLVVCTKKTEDMKSEEVSNGKLQDAPVTYVENGVKESDNASQSELLRDCLIIWRRLKKDNCAEAENVKKTNTNRTVQTSKVSVSGRLRNGRPSSGFDDENSSTSGSASVSSESDDESNSPSEDSKQCRGVMSSSEAQKCSKGRTERESEQPFGDNCMKIPENTIAEKGLMFYQDVPPETNPSEVMQQKEQDDLSCCWKGCSDTSTKPVADSHPESSVHQKFSQQGAIEGHSNARSRHELVVGCDIENTLKADGAKSGEQSTVLELLDKKAAVLCSMDDDSVKDSDTTPCGVTKLDKGTANKFLEKPVNLSTGSNFRVIQWGAVDCNIARIKQENSQHADSEQDTHHKESGEPSQALKVASNQQIPHQFDSDRDNPCTTRQADWDSCSSIPDLNCLPNMNTDDELEPFENVTFQVNGDGTNPQNDIKSLSASSCKPTLQKEQSKQPEPIELTGGICERKDGNRFQSPNSHSGPSQQSIVEESSMSIDVFKCNLCEFIKNIIKPLWEDGLLSREVHKIIVRKAVEKVTTVLGSKVPLTEIDTCRFLLEESQNLEKLVQGYLDLYVGREVLKKKHDR
uniref:Uncharacterized protein n=1 Tax=Oryza meridionalis TaxID=40149 RepID=A0A0E0D2X1_9ORYZ